MTWLKFLNMFILQWFFIRLAKVCDVKTGTVIKYQLLKGIIPTTGWTTDYRYVFNRWISVKNRLPDKKVSVYVLDLPKKLYSLGMYNPVMGADLAGILDWNTMHQDVYMNYEVTHWMPCPKLPKE